MEDRAIIINKRKSNFELLRMVAILMIIAHHSVVHGVMHLLSDNPLEIWKSGRFCNKVFSTLLVPGGEVGVALFFMLTGFFSIKSDEIRLKKIL